MKTTNERIASDWKLWITYVDTAGRDSREWFDVTPVAEKVDIIETCFPESKDLP